MDKKVLILGFYNSFYKDINFLSIQDNVELTKNLQVQRCPIFLSSIRIRPVKLEELYMDEIYFEPLDIYFIYKENKKLIHISPFALTVNGETFYISAYESTIPNVRQMLYLTREGIMEDTTNESAYFPNDRIYWLLSRDSLVRFSVLTC